MLSKTDALRLRAHVQEKRPAALDIPAQALTPGPTLRIGKPSRNIPAATHTLKIPQPAPSRYPPDPLTDTMAGSLPARRPSS
eukprot:702114-Rhodomonas_salina.2